MEASKGHVRDLPTKTLGIDIEHDFAPQYVITTEKQKTIDKLLKEIKSKKYDEVYLATDPDREGEAIAWHLKDTLNIKDNQYKRILFNEITHDKVLEAIKEHRSHIDCCLNCDGENHQCFWYQTKEQLVNEKDKNVRIENGKKIVDIISHEEYSMHCQHKDGYDGKCIYAIDE